MSIDELTVLVLDDELAHIKSLKYNIERYEKIKYKVIEFTDYGKAVVYLLKNPVDIIMLCFRWKWTK